MTKLYLRFLFSLLFFCTLLPRAHAYIPRAQTIVKKMARNNGRFPYKIVREVSLQGQDATYKAKETWYIANGDKMKVVVESLDAKDPWSFVIQYSKDKRQTKSSSGKVRVFKKSKEFFEPLFHDRYSKSLSRRLVGFKFMPDWVINTPQPSFEEGKTKITKENFIQLEPSEGSISYAIGARKNRSGSLWKTVLWVEQDSFLIKKGKLRSNSEFSNSSFQTFVGGLKLPREQRISWGDKVATVKLMAAEKFKPTRKTWKVSHHKTTRIPSYQVVKEFYSRFR